LGGRWIPARVSGGRKLFDLFRTGRLTEEEWCEIEGGIARSAGHCTVMGTVSTMTSNVFHQIFPSLILARAAAKPPGGSMVLQ